MCTQAKIQNPTLFFYRPSKINLTADLKSCDIISWAESHLSKEMCAWFGNISPSPALEPALAIFNITSEYLGSIEFSWLGFKVENFPYVLRTNLGLMWIPSAVFCSKAVKISEYCVTNHRNECTKCTAENVIMTTNDKRNPRPYVSINLPPLEMVSDTSG